jgi:hypothetical protein
MFNTSKIKSLQNQSTKALNIFQATIDSLTKTNAQIAEEKSRTVEAISILLDDAKELTELEAANSKVVSKIQSFLLE